MNHLTGFISGVFDSLHEGHLHLLKEAKKRCDYLIVSINSDSYIRRKKNREPIDRQSKRADNLMKTGLVDLILVRDEDSPLNNILYERPDIIFTGDDYKPENVVGYVECKEWNGEVVTIPKLPGISTTNIIKEKMKEIHITGGLGFIGSNLVRYLNEKNITPYVYDTFKGEQWRNVVGLRFTLRSPEVLLTEGYRGSSSVLVHLGANVDTTESFNPTLWNNNVEYSLKIFKNFGKVIYASSGATYGAEEKDFSERIYGLKPLNAYGFTKWALDERLFGDHAAPIGSQKIYGLRFFNVYGPNEVSKGDMQSVVSRVINKLPPLFKGYTDGDLPGQSKAAYSLFKSDREGVADGEQSRDFVYAGDLCKVIEFFVLQNPESGVYNLGTGKARSFKDLVMASDPNAVIDYVDMPAKLKGQYQYFTQADLTKLRKAGYTNEFSTLEEGVAATKSLTSSKS